MRFYLRILIGLAALSISAHSLNAQGVVMNWTVDGVKREALVFVPEGAKQKEAPLVFGWHGHGGDMHGMPNLMKIQTLWKEAIVVYPQGITGARGANDPQGLKRGWQRAVGELGDRDLKFFDAMWKTLHQEYKVDDKRVYSLGFSNGSRFNYLLWGERGKLIAAFGIVAGAIDPTVHLGPARSVIVIAGSADNTVPFADQLQAIATDRQVDSANGQDQPCGPICKLYSSTTHTPVMTAIHSGGHVFPSFAPEKVTDFFKAHEMP